MSRKDKIEIQRRILLEEYQYMIAGIDIDYIAKTASSIPEHEYSENDPGIIWIFRSILTPSNPVVEA